MKALLSVMLVILYSILNFPTTVSASEGLVTEMESAPSLRALLATSEISYSQEELDGVMEFARANNIGLNLKIDVSTTRDSILLGRDRVSYNKKTRTVTYQGMSFKVAPDQALDLRVREIFNRLKSSPRASAMSFIIPSAFADSKLSSKMQNAGLGAIILGWITPMFASDEFILTAAKWTVRAGFLSLAGGILIDIIAPDAVAAADLPYVVHATCDANGLKTVDQNGNMLSISRASNKLKIELTRKGESPKDYSSEARTPVRTKQLDDMLSLCSKTPLQEKSLVQQLNNVLGRSFKVAASGNELSGSAQKASAGAVH